MRLTCAASGPGRAARTRRLRPVAGGGYGRWYAVATPGRGRAPGRAAGSRSRRRSPRRRRRGRLRDVPGSGRCRGRAGSRRCGTGWRPRRGGPGDGSSARHGRRSRRRTTGGRRRRPWGARLGDQPVFEGEPVDPAEDVEGLSGLGPVGGLSDEPVQPGEARARQMDAMPEDIVQNVRFGRVQRDGGVADELHGMEVAVLHRPQEPLIGYYPAGQGEGESRAGGEGGADLRVLGDPVGADARIFTGVQDRTAGVGMVGRAERLVNRPPGAVLVLGVVDGRVRRPHPMAFGPRGQRVTTSPVGRVAAAGVLVRGPQPAVGGDGGVLPRRAHVRHLALNPGAPGAAHRRLRGIGGSPVLSSGSHRMGRMAGRWAGGEGLGAAADSRWRVRSPAKGYPRQKIKLTRFLGNSLCRPCI